MTTTSIRSRSNKQIGETIDEKWTIVAKQVIAEPTPRTPHDAPRLGIYDYAVVPLGKAAPVAAAADARLHPPSVSFRRIK